MRGRHVAVTLALALLAGGALAPGAAAAETRVSISGFAFDDADVTVAVGDTVRWRNLDSAPHTATAAGVFDSGTLGQGAEFAHTFSDAGTFAYVCAFHSGMTGTVTVAAAPAANAAPVAAFDAFVAGLAVNVDASASTDPDGDALTFAWSWGDGSPAGAGVTASHTFASAGTFTVTLTVTDGALSVSASESIAVGAPASPGNAAPVARFEATLAGPAVSVDARNSTDPDGDALAFAWDWGDGSPAGSGAVASHAFAAAGTFRVRLTVSDGEATASAFRDVTVDANGVPTLALTAPARLETREGGHVVAWRGTARDPDGDALALRAALADGTEVSVAGTATWRVAWTVAAGEPVPAITLSASDGRAESAPLVLDASALPPEVAVAAPAMGARVSGLVPITGTWRDLSERGLAIEVAIDGGAWASATLRGNGTWFVAWDAREAAPGPHEARVRVVQDGVPVDVTARLLVVAEPAPPATEEPAPPPPAARAPGPGLLALGVGLALAALARRRS